MLHLHTRSNYSLLSSALKIEDIIELTKKNNMSAIALVDQDVLFASVPFFDLCKENNIKPIIGIEKTIDENHFIFLAKNDAGYRELMAISKKNVQYNDINKQHLVTILLSHDGEIKQSIIHQQNNEILNILNKYIVDDFYVAITNTEHSIDQKYNLYLSHLLQQHHIKEVAVSYILYKAKEDVEILDALTAIRDNLTLSDYRLKTAKNRHFRTINEMQQLYTKTQLDNTIEIANKCNVKLMFEKNSVPQFNDSANFLKQLCQKGLHKRCNGNIPQKYQERLDYELDIITKMNFSDYFILTWDLVLYSTKQKIYVGPGRGSSAGSLVAYCLGITKIDPVKNNITFERFLNPERITMPDIDLDFPDDKRQEVIEYVINKYGKDKVAHIIAFNTLKAKAALRDVAKIINISNYELEIVLKLIPNKLDITLSEIINIPSIHSIIIKNKKIAKLFSVALKIEHYPRHLTVHASGIVIAEKPIIEHAPLVRVDDMYATQYSMNYLERFGLIKLDFLGLRNLSIIDQCVTKVSEKIGQPFDISKIAYDDNKTYSLLSQGDTLGIFQLESDGMRQLLMKLKPRSIQDIALALALYRPGPMQHIDDFIKKRQYPTLINYYDDSLKPILQETLGTMVYQDQIMQVAQKVANFSLGKADLLRRAMGKKDTLAFTTLENIFKKEALKNNYPQQLINQIFDDMLAFANYGFNKAHAYSYATLSYQMAFLKANTPLYFYTSLLNSAIGSTKMFAYLQEAKKNGIYIHAPDIRYSSFEYTIYNDKIYLPLNAIKGIGITIVEKIINNRSEFKTLEEIVVFCVNYKINRSILENLIYAGALDFLNISRTQLIANLDATYRYCELILVKNDKGEYYPNYDLLTKPKWIDVANDKMKEIQNEKNVLGFYFSTHPITELRNKNYNAVPINELAMNTYQNVLVLIEKIKFHKTKKGDQMCFIVGSDDVSVIDLLLMPQQFEKYKNILKVGGCYFMRIKKDKATSAIIQSMTCVEN